MSTDQQGEKKGLKRSFLSLLKKKAPARPVIDSTVDNETDFMIKAQFVDGNSHVLHRAKPKYTKNDFSWDPSDDTTVDPYLQSFQSDQNEAIGGGSGSAHGGEDMHRSNKRPRHGGPPSNTTLHGSHHASDGQTVALNDKNPERNSSISSGIPTKIRGLSMDEDDHKMVEQSLVPTQPHSALVTAVSRTMGVRSNDRDWMAFSRQSDRQQNTKRNQLQSGVHWSQKSRDDMTAKDWSVFREDFRIVFKGQHVPHPLRSWSELQGYNVPEALINAIHIAGYREPSPIQRAAIPIALENRDMIAIAETGSGKTCSFLIPLLTWVKRQPKMTDRSCMDGPYGIILAPARELAQQIREEAAKFAHRLEINVKCIVGGQSIRDQTFDLQERCEVIIATPGRLVDLLNQKLLVLNQCEYIILDEADKMLEDGLENQLQQILNEMPKSQLIDTPSPQVTGGSSTDATKITYKSSTRRTILYSATMPDKIYQLADKYLDKNRIYVSTGDSDRKIPPSIRQSVEWLNHPDQKLRRLAETLQTPSYQHGKVIVFCTSRDSCNRLRQQLEPQRLSRPIYVLHSDAREREHVLNNFKEESDAVLIATDVAGRGIDVKDIKLVVNYEMPLPGDKAIEAYTHRVGRTGRGGAKGDAISFITEIDKPLFPKLRTLLLDCNVSRIPHQMEQFMNEFDDSRPIDA